MNHPVGLPNTFLEAKTVILKPEDLQEGKFLDVMKRREGGSLDHCPLMKFKTGLVPELDFKACTEVFEIAPGCSIADLGKSLMFHYIYFPSGHYMFQCPMFQ